MSQATVSHVKTISAKSRLTASHAYCIFLVLYPILNRYAAPVPRLTLSEFILLAFLLHAFFAGRLVNVRPVWHALAFAFYLMVHAFLDAANLSGALASDAILSALRVAYLYAGLALLSPVYFDVSMAKRFLTVAAVAVAAYAFIQTVFGFAGIVLTTYIPFLPVMGENLDYALIDKMGYGLRFRCQSILNEPAALCCYLLLPIVMSLFKGRGKKPDYRLALFLSCAALASASSTGIICVMLSWVACFVVHLLTDVKNGGSYLVFFILAALIGGAVIVGSGLWDYFVQRTFGGVIGFSGLSEGTRFYAISDTFDASDSLYGVLFGQGMYQAQNYLPGFSRLYLSLGVIGVLIMATLLLRCLRKGLYEARACTLMFMVLNIGTEILLGNFALYYLTFIFGMEEKQGECTAHATQIFAKHAGSY